MTNPLGRVHVDPNSGSLVVNQLRLDDSRVLTECRHWSSGRRGEAVDLTDLVDTDLTAFAVQAITIGATAMSAAGGVQSTYGIEALVAEVEQRSTKAAADAAARTARVVTDASAALTKASTDAQQLISEAGARSRTSFVQSVDSARTELSRQLAELLGGDEPQLMIRLKPLLQEFSGALQKQAVDQTSDLVAKVARQFDPADPASPMAQQMRSLTETQAGHAATALQQQRLLAERLDALTMQLVAANATDLALATTAAKGATYEDQVHSLMAEIAAGLGDEYVQTGSVVGLRTRSKKGDGVLSVSRGDARVVLEMTDSVRGGWSGYLQDAEANRDAHASLGLVRHENQLRGGPILSFGPRRIVMVFDPEHDSPHLLRCVVQMLRLAAMTAAARVDSGEITSAAERLAEALVSLKRITIIRRSAVAAQRAAGSIDTEAEALETELTRLLTQARSALAGALTETHHDVA